MAVKSYNTVTTNRAKIVKGAITPVTISTKPIAYRSTGTTATPTSYTIGYGT